MTLHFYLCLHLPLESSTVREGAYYQIMQELICWDEVCFRIRSPNPIIYPARALVNTLSMVKCLIDKYWNKIISSCLRFLPALLPGGKEKLKTENWCQTSSDQLFLHTNKSHDPQILIWIIKYIFARITRHSGRAVHRFGQVTGWQVPCFCLCRNSLCPWVVLSVTF